MNLNLPDNFSFRTATDNELPQIIAIWQTNMESRYQAHVDAKRIADYTDTLRELFNTRTAYCNYWVAVDKDTGLVAAWQSYFPVFNTPLRKGAVVESSTYLHPDYQKAGLAYRLMQYALSELKGSPVRLVIGFVAKSNIGALKLVHKIGFEQAGQFPIIPGLFTHHEEKLMFTYKIE